MNHRSKLIEMIKSQADQVARQASSVAPDNYPLDGQIMPGTPQEPTAVRYQSTLTNPTRRVVKAPLGAPQEASGRLKDLMSSVSSRKGRRLQKAKGGKVKEIGGRGGLLGKLQSAMNEQITGTPNLPEPLPSSPETFNLRSPFENQSVYPTFDNQARSLLNSPISRRTVLKQMAGSLIPTPPLDFGQIIETPRPGLSPSNIELPPSHPSRLSYYNAKNLSKKDLDFLEKNFEGIDEDENFDIWELIDSLQSGYTSFSSPRAWENAKKKISPESLSQLQDIERRATQTPTDTQQFFKMMKKNAFDRPSAVGEYLRRLDMEVDGDQIDRIPMRGTINQEDIPKKVRKILREHLGEDENGNILLPKALTNEGWDT
jgi:hypothetical protein